MLIARCSHAAHTALLLQQQWSGSDLLCWVFAVLSLPGFSGVSHAAQRVAACTSTTHASTEEITTSPPRTLTAAPIPPVTVTIPLSLLARRHAEGSSPLVRKNPTATPLHRSGPGCSLRTSCHKSAADKYTAAPVLPRCSWHCKRAPPCNDALLCLRMPNRARVCAATPQGHVRHSLLE